MFISSAGAVSQIKAGKVRVLAVASSRRAQPLPDTPTFAEAGYPQVLVDTRYGILAQGSTPPATVNRLQSAMSKILSMPDVRERYTALGLEAMPSKPQEYAAFLREEVARWRKVVIAAKLPPQ
jgi:tripartite-type tricarboxylate transporter receptor subunit TctC